MVARSVFSAASLSEAFRIPWRFGGIRQRVAILLFPAACVSIATVFGTLIALNPPFDVQMSLILAITTYGAFMDANLQPLYSDRVLEETLRRGWWGDDEPYFAEMSRFLKAHGDRGLARGAFQWALLAWGLYYLTWGWAIVFSYAMLGILGPWTPFAFAAADVPIAFGFYLANGRRVKQLYREAERAGFYLRELSPSRKRKGSRGAEHESVTPRP